MASSKSQDSNTPQSPFPAPARHITTHDPTTRFAVFSSALPDTVSPLSGPGTVLHDAYATLSHPVELSDDVDIAAFKAHKVSARETPGGVWFPGTGETLVRFCDWAPGTFIPQHRTATVDFGVVVFGTVEAILDSGESRLLRAGDVIVQRGTRHAWRNPSEDQWVRIVVFLVGTNKARVAGEELGADLPWEVEGEEEGQGK